MHAIQGEFTRLIRTRIYLDKDIKRDCLGCCLPKINTKERPRFILQPKSGHPRYQWRHCLPRALRPVPSGGWTQPTKERQQLLGAILRRLLGAFSSQLLSGLNLIEHGRGSGLRWLRNAVVLGSLTVEREAVLARISVCKQSLFVNYMCEKKKKMKINRKRAATLQIVLLFERHRVESKCREQRAKRPKSDMSLSERPADDPSSEF